MMKRSQAKRALLRTLSTTYAKGTDLAALLWLQGNNTEARQIESANAGLRKEIDTLRRALWQNWKGRLADLESQIRDQNATLQRRIRGMERSLEVTAELGRSLSLLRDIAKLARGLL